MAFEIKKEEMQKIVIDLVEKAWRYTELDFNKKVKEEDINSSADRVNFIKEFFNENGFHSLLSYKDYIDTKTDFQKINPNIDYRLKEITDTIDYISLKWSPELDHALSYIVKEDETEDYMEDIFNLLSYNTIQPINTSRNRLSLIFSYWINRAKQLSGRKISSPIFEDHCTATRFLFRGKPGVGKTTLLNYLFAVNSFCLLNHSIIWTRVSMSQKEDISLDLKSTLYAKFLKIFCTNYLYEREYEKVDPNGDKLRAYLETSALSSEEFRQEKDFIPDYIKRYFRILGEIKDKGKKEDINRTFSLSTTAILQIYNNKHLEIETVNSLTERLLVFLQTKLKYGYIFIIDGFDNVTIDFIQRRFFREWMDKINGITNNKNNPFHAIYIIAMRDYSFVDFYKKFAKQTLDNRFIEFKVVSQSLESIFLSKAKVSAMHLYPSKPSTSSDEKTTFNILTNILRMMLFDPQNDLILENEITTNSSLFIKASELSNENIRALMRFVKIVIKYSGGILGGHAFYFLSQEKLSETAKELLKRKYWAICELMMMGDPSYTKVYKNRVTYSEDPSDSQDDPVLMRIEDVGRALAPNIFNYCEINDTKISPPSPKILFQIRVLQYLLQEGQRAYIKEIINWYKSNFRYRTMDRRDLRYELREMIYNGLINADIPDLLVFDKEIMERNYPVRISTLAKKIVDSFLKQSIYYVTVCGDTPIPRRIAKLIEPKSCIELYSCNISLAEYERVSIKNAINFLLYLKMVEGYEKKEYAISKDLNSYTDNNLEIFSDTVLSEIKKSFQKAITGYLYNISEDGMEIFKQHINDWFTYFNVPLDDREVLLV